MKPNGDVGVLLRRAELEVLTARREKAALHEYAQRLEQDVAQAARLQMTLTALIIGSGGKIVLTKATLKQAMELPEGSGIKSDLLPDGSAELTVHRGGEGETNPSEVPTDADSKLVIPESFSPQSKG